jgi:hypothetical protein
MYAWVVPCMQGGVLAPDVDGCRRVCVPVVASGTHTWPYMFLHADPGIFTEHLSWHDCCYGTGLAVAVSG